MRPHPENAQLGNVRGSADRGRHSVCDGKVIGDKRLMVQLAILAPMMERNTMICEERLNAATTVQDLLCHFRSYGQIDSCKIRKTTNGICMGHISFLKQQSANATVQLNDGEHVTGYPDKTKFAKVQRPITQAMRRASDDGKLKFRVRITNLSQSCKVAEVLKIFEPHAEIGQLGLRTFKSKRGTIEEA